MVLPHLSLSKFKGINGKFIVAVLLIAQVEETLPFEIMTKMLDFIILIFIAKIKSGP